MQNPFTKIYRYLRREFPVTSMAIGISLSFACFYMTMALMHYLPSEVGFFSCAPLIMCGLGGVIGFLDVKRCRTNSLDINGYKLIGDKKSLSSVAMTQVLIKNKTWGVRDQLQMPAKYQQIISAHIADIQPAIAHLRIIQNGQPVQSFDFQRQYLDIGGNDAIEKIPAILASPAAAVVAVISPVALSRPIRAVKPFNAGSIPPSAPANNAPAASPPSPPSGVS